MSIFGTIECLLVLVVIHFIICSLMNIEEKASSRMLKIETFVMVLALTHKYLPSDFISWYIKISGIFLLIGIQYEIYNIGFWPKCYLFIGISLLLSVFLWHPGFIYMLIDWYFLIFDSVWLLSTFNDRRNLHNTAIFIFGCLREVYHMFACAGSLAMLVAMFDIAIICYVFYNTVHVQQYANNRNYLLAGSYLFICMCIYFMENMVMMLNHLTFLVCMIGYYLDAHKSGLISLLTWCNKMGLCVCDYQIDDYTGKIKKRTRITLLYSITMSKQEICRLADKENHFDSITCDFNDEWCEVAETSEKKVKERVNLFNKILMLNSSAVDISPYISSLPHIKLSFSDNIFIPHIYMLLQQLNLHKDIKTFISQTYVALILAKITSLPRNKYLDN